MFNPPYILIQCRQWSRFRDAIQTCNGFSFVLGLHVSYTVSGKKRVYSVLGITLSNTGRFSKFFHFQNRLEICNKAIVKYPTSPQTRHYTTL